MNTEELTTKMNNLIEVSHSIAKEKGWWDEPRDDRELLLLMQSEIAEALEEFRNHRKLDEVYYEGDKPAGIPIELADVVIRIADYCGSREVKFQESDLDPGTVGLSRFIPVLFFANYNLSNAFDKADYGKEYLGRAVKIIFDFYENEEYVMYDLWQAIDIKTAFNRTRPFRHGGKKA